MLTFALGVLVGAVVVFLVSLPHVLRKVAWRDRALKAEKALYTSKTEFAYLNDEKVVLEKALNGEKKKNHALATQVAQMSQR